jgi:hypothetical protein
MKTAGMLRRLLYLKDPRCRGDGRPVKLIFSSKKGR